MQTVELGRTGEHVSHLALGAMQMGNRTAEPDAVRMLDRYLDAGGSFLDTADCYEWWAFPGSRGGQSEELLGRWMRGGRRDRVFLATKGAAMPIEPNDLWGADGVPDWDLAWRTFSGAGRDSLRRSLEGSLRRLGTDHVDLYYVHVDDRSTPLEETLETLDGFVRAGTVRHIGWSNVHTWRLERILGLCAQNGWTAPVAVQQQHSYLRPAPGANTLSITGAEQLDHLAANPQVSLVAYSPLLKGIYDDAAKRDGHAAMADYAGPDSDARLAVLTQVAAEVGATPNQTVLAWLLHQDAPTVVPLVGPRTPDQLDDALGALEVKLTPDQVERLTAAGA
ncbi:aldo/keto reductase [Mangrovihabitans endophyticus]|nr:aldo/keto reductase [Mangrovihabitans endophyticus]